MISYQNFLLNTLMDIKLLAGFRSTIPMLGKKKKKETKESASLGSELSISWCYVA